MRERVLRVLIDLWTRIRVTDILDVLVVAAFVYATLLWVRRARSRFVMAGFAALVGVYFVAQWLDMYLTLFLFQVGITVALVTLIVIFQEEIRRAFERIATSRWLRASAATSGSTDVIDTVVESVTSMAENHTGALIVFKGKEPLERHASGGVALNGTVSEPLLQSIFDSGSAGHDGALIIEGDSVARFAAHLPLTTQVKDDARYGTRHAAALGLSERSDALVVVVSEERGSISIARAGTLVPVTSAAELKQRLQAFAGEITPQRRVPLAKHIFTGNLGLKLLSLAVAAGAWLAVFGYQGETVVRTFTVPVTVRDVPEGWLLDEPNPHEVTVTLAGSTRAFQLVEPARLTVNLELGPLVRGTQAVAIREQDLDLPKGFVVHRIDPRDVILVAHRTVTVEVPVRAQTRGNPKPGLRIERIRTEPAEVRLVVRVDERSRYTSVLSDPVDLGSIEHTISLKRSLILPKQARLAAGERGEVIIVIETTSAGPAR